MSTSGGGDAPPDTKRLRLGSGSSAISGPEEPAHSETQEEEEEEEEDSSEGAERWVGERFEAHAYVSPVPPPQVLAAYKEVMADGPDRIYRMVESEQQHRRLVELEIIKGEREERGVRADATRRGQFLGAGIGVVTLGVAAFAIDKGVDWAAVTAIFAGVTGVIAPFLWVKKRKKKKKPEAEEGDDEDTISDDPGPQPPAPRST